MRPGRLLLTPVKLFKLYRVYAPVDSLICNYLFSLSSTFNTILLILYPEPTAWHSIRQYQKAKTNSLSSPSPRNIPRLMQRKLILNPRGVEAADTVADMCWLQLLGPDLVWFRWFWRFKAGFGFQGAFVLGAADCMLPATLLCLCSRRGVPHVRG